MFLVTLILLAIAAAIAYILSNTNKISRPPGVGIPSIVFFFIGFWHPHLAKFLTAVGKKHGPIVHVGLGPFKTVIVNGADAVREACKQPMLNGRAENMYKKLFGSKGIFFVDDSTPTRKFVFRNSRHFGLGGKLAENNIHEEISFLFKHFDSFEGKAFPVKHAFNIPAINGVSHRLLGEKIPHDDPKLKSIVEKLCLIAEVPNPIKRTCVGAPQVTGWIPGSLSGWNFAKNLYQDALDLFNPYIEKHRKGHVRNQPRDIVDSLMDEVEATIDLQSPFHSSHDPIGPILFDMLLAAVETTPSILEWIILYLSQYPLVQQKLQIELDDVIGPDRLPQLSDRANMPYFQAFLQEIFRLVPALPLAYHSALGDAKLGGYTIEKGTTVISNFYGIHMDPKVWDEPEQLRPDRFIDAEGNFVKSDQLFTFGSGRRSCVGEVIARDQLFLYISRIVQAYTLVPEKKLESFFGGLFIVYHCCAFKTAFTRRT